MKAFQHLILSSLLASTMIVQARDEFHNPLAYSILLEDAMTNYQQHFGDTDDCERRSLDLYLSPLYNYKFNNHEDKSHTYGGFFKGQLNIGNLWLRTTTAFVKISASDKSGSSKTSIPGFTSSHFGVDDATLKLGYDFTISDCHFWNLYGQVGFPTHKTKEELETEAVTSKSTVSKEAETKVEIVTNALGSKNWTVGGGIGAGISLYDTDRYHIAFLLDARYRYALPATYGKVEDVVTTKPTGPEEHTSDAAESRSSNSSSSESSSSSSASTESTNPSQEIVRFTPGHTIDIWSAFNFRFSSVNLELGNVFGTTFLPKGKIKDLTPRGTESTSGSIEAVKPAITKFSFTPYASVSYSCLLFDFPTIIGIGLAYSYEQESGHNNINNNIMPWVTVGISF